MKELEKKLAKVLSGLHAADNYLREDLDAICDDTMREHAEDALDRVDASIKEAEKLLEEVCTKSNGEMARDLLREEGFFYITSVHRDDLEAVEFDVSEVSDEQMERLAKQMRDDYCTQMFHESMEILAECLEFPKKEGDEYEDE